MNQVLVSSPQPDIQRTPLHKQVAAHLRKMIVEGELAPGARVPERILCERFGISRTPLREALKALSYEGLLELNPNRGATVTEVSEGAVDEMYPVIGALEALAGRLACANISKQQLADLEDLHAQMLDHFRSGNANEYFRANEQIHEAILQASHNAVLVKTYHDLSRRVRRMRYIARLTPERWQQAVSEHEQMIRALRERDGEGLAKVLQKHLETKLETVKSHLREKHAHPHYD
jgi:DNA-binding GntR family transcriptional regulator